MMLQVKFYGLSLFKSESFEGVAGAAKKYMEKYGRPVAFYVDYGSVFSVNTNNAEQEKKTQFERIMNGLDIHVNHANSPQAKGRVERCNSTMQDRLVKEMRLANISSMDEANRFVQHGDFIEKHNAKFAVPAAQEGDAHRPTQDYNLYEFFCAQEERIIANDYTFKYRGTVIQLVSNQPIRIRPKNHVVICEHLDGKITVRFKDYQLNFKEFKMRKLSPIDHVLQENGGSLENRVPDIPLEGSLGVAISNPNLAVENRNFSLC